LDIAISDKQLLLLQAEKLSQEYTAPTVSHFGFSWHDRTQCNCLEMWNTCATALSRSKPVWYCNICNTW